MLSRSDAEKAIQEKASKLTSQGVVGREGDMVMDWTLRITDQNIDQVIKQEGKFDLRLRIDEREELSSFPLSHSDSIQLGMGYCVNIVYGVEILPLRPE